MSDQFFKDSVTGSIWKLLGYKPGSKFLTLVSRRGARRRILHADLDERYVRARPTERF